MSSRPSPKFGAGHLEAFGRQGMAEIRNALYPESNVAQRHAEPGIYGTAVPSEVDRQRQAEPVAAPEGKDAHLDAERDPPQPKERQPEPELERD